MHGRCAGNAVNGQTCHVDGVDVAFFCNGNFTACCIFDRCDCHILYVEDIPVIVGKGACRKVVAEVYFCVWVSESLVVFLQPMKPVATAAMSVNTQKSFFIIYLLGL